MPRKKKEETGSNKKQAVIFLTRGHVEEVYGSCPNDKSSIDAIKEEINNKYPHDTISIRVA